MALSRENVLRELRRHFSRATAEQLAAAANAVVGLEDEWEEIPLEEVELGTRFSVLCEDICYLADQVKQGTEFRIFRKRRPEAAASSGPPAADPEAPPER